MSPILIEESAGFTPDERETDLLRLLPAIRRARDFRLYAEGGLRFLDLWQYGGRAILGHTPPSVLRELKNTAERGLFAPFPSPLEGRFLKALARLFPNRVFRLYAGDAALAQALSAAGLDPLPLDPALYPLDDAKKPGKPPAEPAHPVPYPLDDAGGPRRPPPESARPVLWRPFLGDGPPFVQDASGSPSGNPAGNPPVILPVLPLPWGPRVLVLDAALENLPPSDILSPAILAAATRALWDLIAALPLRSIDPPREIREALSQGPWQRRGVYLSMRASPAGTAAGADLAIGNYAARFRRFLDRGFLLPPNPRDPLILPGSLSAGEAARLAALLEER
jgi:hypothetical protein